MEATYKPKALTPDELHALSQEVKQALTDLYGDRLDRVILYGSYARGDFHAESDVDYLVVLRDEDVKGGLEVRRMSSIIGTLSLKYITEVSVFPAAAQKYQAGYTPLYQSVMKEGRLL